MEEKLNLGNAIYEGFNDQHGLMICGYEWGEEAQRKGQIVEPDMSKKCTFSNKSLRYGDMEILQKLGLHMTKGSEHGF